MSQSKVWKVFANHLGSTANEDELNDVTFTFNNNNEQTCVKANRGLLSLLSPVFRSMFNNGMKESFDNNSIQIKDSDVKSFTLFVKYFYGVDPEITATNIGILSYLAEKYLVSGLQECCRLFLTESITIDNLIPVLEALYKHHQNKLFEHCKVWMNEQSSSNVIINMFKSDAFMNTNSVIVGVLLSGFGKVIDATILWQCTVQWSETKVQNKNENDDNKDDEKNEEVESNINPKYEKLKLIREHFPFYRLPMQIISNQVLPLNIISKEMGLEVLIHKTYGSYHQLAQYCASHYSQNNIFPKVDIETFEFGQNKEKWEIESKSAYEYTVSYTNNDVEILFANVPMESDEKWSWEIFLNKKENNYTDLFGIDAIENTKSPGYSKNNSWSIYVDLKHIVPYAKSSSQPDFKPGVKNGDLLRLEFDGPCSQLLIYLNDKRLYCFNHVKCDQPLYPSFYINSGNTIFTVRNFRKL